MAGEAAGVDKVTILRWEAGLFSPSSDRIARVAQAYGLDVSALIDTAETGQQDEFTSVLPINGYLEAGTTPKSQTDELGSISVPSLMIQGSPGDSWWFEVNPGIRTGG